MLWLFLLLWLLALRPLTCQEAPCSMKCTCKLNSQRDGGNYLKMTCGETEEISHLDELELLNLASELVQLNISNNALKKFRPKVELIALQKLNISGNQLTSLEENQFKEVPKLRRLDVSYNKIKHIDVKAFAGLKDLERLKLNHNDISIILAGTFDYLPRLKQLDISNNPLQCDCGLLWILEYLEKVSLKLISNPKCGGTIFKSTPLRKLKVGEDIHCKASQNNLLPLLDLKPDHNQVVFEGDSLKLQCKAPTITDSVNSSNLEWLWVDTKPTFSDITIVKDFHPNPGIVNSVLYIKKLSKSHSGVWSCLFNSIQGSHAKNVSIIVITDDTQYCPVITVRSNKGAYTFPKTIANNKVTLPCQFHNDYYDLTYQQVEYDCSQNATWTNLDTLNCSYISDTTRILEGFSNVNSSILESAKHLKEFTSNVTIFQDIMDLVYTVRAMQNYAHLQTSESISNILMDVSNNLLYLPWTYLRQAEEVYGSCSGIVKIQQEIAMNYSAVLFQRENVVVEAFPMGKENFPGIKCSWFRNGIDSPFFCSTNNMPDPMMVQNKILETSVIVPDNIENVEGTVVISTYTSSKFFPIDAARIGKEGVTSAVIGVNIVGASSIDLLKPIIVTIRAPYSSSYEVTPFTPIWWNDSNKQWTVEVCRLGHHWQDHVVFQCQKLGFYGLMQDVSFSNVTGTYKGMFRASHPAIYIGNFILIISLLVAILTYIFGFVSIQMAKKAKHCLINTWTSIVLLCFLYSFGIYQTEDQRLCQIIGLTLHYLTLSALLWMCVTLNSMYKRLSKNGESILQDDDLPSEQPIKKPLMGLYLVGWGVALIVCGLSAAINVREYASASHCFLRTGPALSALYVPFSILFLFMLVFILLVRCAISNLDLSHGGHLSEDSFLGTQATEHVDLDLLEPSFPAQDSRSVQSYSSKTASSEMEDNERSPLAQLKAHIIFVFLFVFTWLSCAFATVPPLRLVTYEADLFSVAYAICSTTLSAFTLFFYCIARNDVRTQWITMFRWMRHKRLVRPRTVSDTQPRLPVQPLPLPPISNSEAQALSRSSSRSSGRKSCSLKGAVAYELNGSLSDRPSVVGGSKINNVNLITLHRAHYRTAVVPHIIENPTSAAEVFYNPHQSTVARKFFRRQRRDMMKRNNLQPKPPRDVNSDVTSVFSEPRMPKHRNTEQNMFGTNSKVNNTNIHVEHIRKSQKKNPNIFSDSGDDFDCLSDVPVDKLERLQLFRNKNRKKSNLTHSPQSAQMRTVSQQCTLEYSSENPLSDSVLDKSDLLSPLSPAKSLPVRKLLAEESSSTPMETSGTTGTHSSTRRENSPADANHYAEIDELSESTVRADPLIRLRSQSTFSRASSVSATDIDELYQQIRRGPIRSQIPPQRAYSSPFLSDSEFHVEIQTRRDIYDDVDVETTV